MRVGILTHYNVASHGAYLQLYAMCRVLQQMGHTPIVMTYKKNFDFMSDEESKKFQVRLRSVPYYLKEYLLKSGVSNVVFQIRKHNELKKFGSIHFAYAPYALETFDAVIIGSDEVMSLQCGINLMMYGHGVRARKVLTYAPSFGQTDMKRIDEFRMRELIASGLNSIDGLSARDAHTKALIENLTGKTVPIVCDPALLYSFDEEKQFAINPPINAPYILVYAYSSNLNEERVVDAIQCYAHKKGCKTVSLEGYHKWCDKNISCDPVAMLSWFAHATAVVTDTFHGTISSIITHAPLALFQRESNTVKMNYLVKQLGIEAAQIEAAEQLEHVLVEPLNYNAIEGRLLELRAAGMRYLEDQLTSIPDTLFVSADGSTFSD